MPAAEWKTRRNISVLMCRLTWRYYFSTSRYFSQNKAGRKQDISKQVSSSILNYLPVGINFSDGTVLNEGYVSGERLRDEMKIIFHTDFQKWTLDFSCFERPNALPETYSTNSGTRIEGPTLTETGTVRWIQLEITGFPNDYLTGEDVVLIWMACLTLNHFQTTRIRMRMLLDARKIKDYEPDQNTRRKIDMTAVHESLFLGYYPSPKPACLDTWLRHLTNQTSISQ